MRTDVLGVGFDALTMDQAVRSAEERLDRGVGGYIVTANPEALLRCRRDKAFAAAVNGADLVLADGVGDLYAARILGRYLPERVTGSDLAPRLLTVLAERRGSVFLFGGKPGVARRAGENLEKEYPGLRIVGTENGYIFQEEELLSRLRETAPDLLLVALGAPRQELWMQRRRGEIPSLMLGVGGLLDVWAGDLRRAPEVWQRAGLEWMYRLGQEPRRIGRMIRLPGVIFLALGERLSHRKKRGG